MYKIDMHADKETIKTSAIVGTLPGITVVKNQATFSQVTITTLEELTQWDFSMYRR